MIDTNSRLMAMALQLSSHGHRAKYERLEFLGDRVVGLVVAEMLYRLFPQEKEGEMARRFVALTREETLANIAEQIGLPEKLKTTEDRLRHNASVLSDVCEAVIAAIYLEKGLDDVRQFMEPLWRPLIDAEDQAPQDAKSSLQEWSQHRYQLLPIYELVDRKGPDHAPSFTVVVKIKNMTATGVGTSKKLAEQQAAETFLNEVVNGHK